MPEKLNTKNQNISDIGAVDGERIKKPALAIDYARYEKFLAETDLAEAQKKEFLDTLWSIIIAFVDLGYGVHPLQQVDTDKCGQEIDLSGLMASDVVKSVKANPTSEFETAVTGVEPARRESEQS